jgi:hypothetical protein
MAATQLHCQGDLRPEGGHDGDHERPVAADSRGDVRPPRPPREHRHLQSRHPGGGDYVVEGTLENWESEFLQMAAFVLLTVFLVEKGSAESKKSSADEDIASHHDDPDAPWPIRRGGPWLTLYENSLFLAFLALFVLSIAGHALGGAREYSEDQESHGHPAVTTVEFVETSDFWYQSFQNW